jgi:hypothetical protein
VTLTITIDPVTGEREITADSGGTIPAVVDGSVTRMASQLAVVREIHRGVDVDTVVFADVAYLGN